MAQKAFIFSEDAAKRIVKATRFVEALPQSTAGQRRAPNSSGNADVWLKIASGTSGFAPREYTVDVYATPYDSTAIAEGIDALNVAEIGFSTSSGCGYSFDATSSGAASCGDIYGLADIETGRFVKSQGIIEKDGEWTYLFDYTLIPMVKR